MILKKNYINKYDHFIHNIFFLLFTSPILSPYISGFTFYLYWIIPLIDHRFLKSLSKIKFKTKDDKTKILILLFMGIIMLISNEIILLFKYIIIVYNLIYLFYLRRINQFKLLYRFIFFNIFVAMIQWGLYIKSPRLSYLIGPTNIAKTLYGSYAGPTFTNFYSIFYLHRASGLSRETGFFCTLLIITFLFYLREKKQTNIERYIFIIGLIISMTKMIIILPIVLILKKLKKYLKKIPLLLGIILIIVFFIILTEYLYRSNFFIKANETWNHRIGGYKVLFEIGKDNIFSRYSSIEILSKKFMNIRFIGYLTKLKKFTGIPEIIMHDGIVIFITYIFLLKIYRVNFYKFLILFCITFGVGFSTATSFVVLSYLYILTEKKKK